MRTQKLAGVAMRALLRVNLARSRIADTERAVAPNGVHDHRQLARYGDTGLAVAGALGDLLTPALDLVPALEARDQT